MNRFALTKAEPHTEWLMPVSHHPAEVWMRLIRLDGDVWVVSVDGEEFRLPTHSCSAVRKHDNGLWLFSIDWALYRTSGLMEHSVNADWGWDKE